MTGGTGAGTGAGHGRKGSGGPLALYLDGRLRVSAENEFRYHEALVHPAMAGGPRGRVLVLGGGDGLAVREILRYRSVRSVTVVELDPGVLRLARTDPGLTRLNRHSLADPRVRTVTADAFDWLRQRGVRGPGRMGGAVRRHRLRPSRPRDHREHQALLAGVLRPRGAVAGPRRAAGGACRAADRALASVLDGGVDDPVGGPEDGSLPAVRTARGLLRRPGPLGGRRPAQGPGGTGRPVVARDPVLGLPAGRTAPAVLRTGPRRSPTGRPEHRGTPGRAARGDPRPEGRTPGVDADASAVSGLRGLRCGAGSGTGPRAAHGGCWARTVGCGGSGFRPGVRKCCVGGHGSAGAG